MNPRERFLEVALFGKPDKIPLAVGDIRPATRARWIREGMPENVSIGEYFGLSVCGLNALNVTSYPSEGFNWFPSDAAVNLGPIPPFEYRVLREDDRYRVWVDSLGVTQMGFRSDWENGWSGFATRVFIDFPVKNWKDFYDVKRRYNPKDPRRYPKNWEEIARRLRSRDMPLCITIRAPFWWTRDMMGLKGLLTGLYREPELIKEIMDFCAEFHVEVLHRAMDEVGAEYVVMNEDMAYKNGPMISPEAVRRFMSDSYRMITKFFNEHGVKIIIVDSDGNVEPLIPVWLGLGINGITPCEVAAGMDVVKLGEKYPNLIMIGGLDKRALAMGRKSIGEEVLSKVPPLVKRRGYFPGVDHAVPPNVSLENFRYFVKLLKELCGWNRV